MTKTEIEKRIATLEADSQKLTIIVNKQIGWNEGQIALLKELLTEQSREPVTNPESTT